MQSIRFSEPYPEAYTRGYPSDAPGWVSGVYEERQPDVRRLTPDEQSGDGLLFSVRRLVEDSEPYNGDPSSIARTAYQLGTYVVLSGQARNFHMRLEVQGLGCPAQTFLVVADGQDCKQFGIEGAQRLSVDVEVAATRRNFELTFSPVPQGDSDTTTEWAGIRLLGLSIEQVATPSRMNPQIFIAADSTAQTYFSSEAPQAGWGEWLPRYLMKHHTTSSQHDPGSDVPQSRVFHGDGPVIHNRALGGRGLKSYLVEHRLHKILTGLAIDDVVLIQFGINDASKTRPLRYIPVNQYRNWVDRYVVSVADRGGRPVLVTAVPEYPEESVVESSTLLEQYADVIRQYAVGEGVPLIDLRERGREFLTSLPPENVDAPFLRYDPLQYARHPDGAADTMHLGTMGAKTYARIVAQELSEIYPEFAFYDDEPGTPEAVADLTAEGFAGIVGSEWLLTWRPSAHANYYVVEKRSAEGRRYTRSVIVKPWFHDLPLPGQSRRLTFTVTAWRDAIGSEPRSITVLQSGSDGLLHVDR